MDQPTLFNVEPRETPQSNAAPYPAMVGMEPQSRSSDPLPSYKAADQLKRSGVGGKRRLAIYLGLRQHQGATSAELARSLNLDRYEPSRRLPELRRAGWVCNGPRRRCTVSGIVSETWYITRPWIDKPRKSAPVPPGAQPHDDGRAGEKQARPLTAAERRQVLRERAEAGDAGAKVLLEALEGRGR